MSDPKIEFDPAFVRACERLNAELRRAVVLVSAEMTRQFGELLAQAQREAINRQPAGLYTEVDVP